MNQLLQIIFEAIVVMAATWLYLRKEIVALRKSANESKKSLADSEKSIGETYRGMLEEFRTQYNANLNAMKDRYDEQLTELKKRVDDLEDELKARQRTDQSRQEQLTEALSQKEYFRGKVHEAEHIIEKHLKQAG